MRPASADVIKQIGQQLEIAGALLHADEPVNLAQHAVEQGGRTISPGHDVVDHDRLCRSLRQCRKVIEHHFVAGAEEIVHRRHLQGGDIQVGQCLGFFNRLPGAVDDDAGDDGRSAQRRLRRQWRRPAAVRRSSAHVPRRCCRRRRCHARRPSRSDARLRAQHKRFVEGFVSRRKGVTIGGAMPWIFIFCLAFWVIPS